MYVYVNFRFLADSEVDLENAKEFFGTNGYELSTGGQVLYAYGERESYWDDEPIETYYMRKAYYVYLEFSKLLDHDFVLEGTIDTSETAGEYMDFRFENVEGETQCYYSDFYLVFHKFAYGSFEEFHEEFGDKYSKEYFDELSDDTYYQIREKPSIDFDYEILVKEVTLNPISIEVFVG